MRKGWRFTTMLANTSLSLGEQHCYQVPILTFNWVSSIIVKCQPSGIARLAALLDKLVLTLYNYGAHPVYASIGTLQQCCSSSYKRWLALYNTAAHPAMREDWHFTTMLLTELYLRVGTSQ
jgi:hypothetical protein